MEASGQEGEGAPAGERTGGAGSEGGRLQAGVPTSVQAVGGVPTSAQAAAEVEGLLRRREELAGEIAELHWDLGGLAYEMAIRDHFRPEVLIRRAALLQERDTELAEIERKLGAHAATAPPPELPVTPPPVERVRRFPALGVWALLAVACLGFGAGLGHAGGGSTATDRLSAARPALRLVLPARTGSPTTPPLPQATATPSGGESEAGSSEEPVEASSQEAAKHGGKQSSSSSSSSAGSKEAGKEGSGGGSSGEGSAQSTKPPPIKHVFLVVLDDEPYATAFGPSSPASYLTHTLEKRGELLVRYYAVAHEQLGNGIALISGQGPTAQTAENCPTYVPVAPATAGSEGQVLGSGCVYPTTTQTVAGQLEAKHLTWRAYVEGMDEGGGVACAHPALGSADPTSFDPGAGVGNGTTGAGTTGAGTTGAGTTGADGTGTTGAGTTGADGTTGAGATIGAGGGAGAGGASLGPTAPSPGAGPYATFRNPFVYFQSIAGSAACAADDVGIDKLKGDLADPGRTPSLSYIVPDLCDDGSPTPCAPGKPTGMQAADGFLKRVVPEILAAKAFRKGGLLAITVDEAPSTGEYADSSSCCEQPRFPNLPAPTGAAALSPVGGGEVGALLLSPYVKGGTTSQEPFNHYSLLRTIENLFHLGHLGYAANAKVGAFGAAVFNASGG